MKKFMTREQAQTAKDRGVRFDLNVRKDQEAADALDDLSLDEWAEKKGVTLTNPVRRQKSPHFKESEDRMRRVNAKAPTTTKADLLDRIKELEDENDDLNDQLDSVTDKLEAALDIVAPDEEDSDDGAGVDDGDDNGDDGGDDEEDDDQD